jgi:hypothetical protein
VQGISPRSQIKETVLEKHQGLARGRTLPNPKTLAHVGEFLQCGAKRSQSPHRH